jgi:hypothetical protein
MRYFVRIGGIPGTTTGIGSRGWAITRRDTTVEISWGAVEVERRGNSTTFFWARGRPQTKPIDQPSIQAANALIKERIAEQRSTTARSGGYQRLPAGIRIYARRRR